MGTTVSMYPRSSSLWFFIALVQSSRTYSTLRSHTDTTKTPKSWRKAGPSVGRSSRARTSQVPPPCPRESSVMNREW